jgi:23S rRNA 5-hydroxycytidine C2501 synthase
VRKLNHTTAKVRQIELLSPAKDLSCGIAAVNCGADAVYIGAPRFSARQAAAAEISDIEKLSSYAAKYGAKVYVALNTLLLDSEIDDACKILWQAYEAGASAAILQDMGLLQCSLPPMELHASTQTDNRSPEKVAMLEKAGFSQIVLARELSLQQITEISSKCSAKLEFFVHGALCTSYSGQCYISQHCAQRSANRGQCAQFCRHSFTLEDTEGRIIAKDKHLLSLKDLDLSASLGQLAAAGISSFKIEGRLKDKAYVKNTALKYRRAIDSILAGMGGARKSSSGSVVSPIEPDASKTFNRGFSSYFIEGRQQGIAAIESPKNIGQLIGKVTRAARGKIWLDSQTEINNGDGLSYFSQGKLCGARVSEYSGQCAVFNSPIIVPVGTEIFRNFDRLLAAETSADRETRTISLEIKIKAAGGNICAEATDEDGNKAAASIAGGTEAHSPGKAAEALLAAFSKTGGSIFSKPNIVLEMPVALFFPQSELNKCRRNLLEALVNTRLESFRNNIAARPAHKHSYPHSLVTYKANITNKKAADFYRSLGADAEIAGAETCQLPAGAELMRCRYCIAFEIGICNRYSATGSKGPQPELMLRDSSKLFRLKFDCAKCEMVVTEEKQSR